MINRNENRAVKPSFVPKFSDPDIMRSVINSDIWKHIFLRERKALWIFVKAIVVLKMEMFISPLKAFLRYGHGKRTTGIIIIVMSSLMMIAFNTKSIVGVLATFFPLAAPVIPFLMSGDQIIAATFIDIRSQYLLCFWGAYVFIASVQLILVYAGIGNTDAPTKRGTSLLHSTVLVYFKVPEYIVYRFIEPLLVGVTGYVLCVMQVDFTFGIFLIVAAVCLLIQESYDAVLQFAIRS